MGSLDNVVEDQDEIEVTWSDEQANEAEAMGWIPPERSKKMPNGKKFVGPQEFMERNPLYNRVKDMESTLSQVMAHNSKVNASNLEKQKTDYETRINSLEAAKLQALNEADHERVIEIDKKLRTEEPPKDDDDPMFASWVKNNAWYKDNKFLAIEADIIGEKYARMGMQGDELYKAVTEHVKKVHPDEFSNPNRSKPSSVESGSNAPTKKESASVSGLTADEKTVYSNFKRMGIFSEKGAEEAYIKQVMEQRD